MNGLSIRDVLQGELNQILSQISIYHPQDVINKLIDYNQRFKLFRLKVTLKKKLQMEPCVGACEAQQIKHVKRTLISFPDHIHYFCQNCITGWIDKSFNSNPRQPIKCEKCFKLNKEGPYYTDNDICTFLNTDINTINYIRQTFVDPSSLANCSVCPTQSFKTSMVTFLCFHTLCQICVQRLIKETLDRYYDIFLNPQSPLDNLIFELKCPCGSDKSAQNFIVSDIFTNLANCSSIPNLDQYLNFVNTYRGFFSRSSKLTRCPSCLYVFEITQAIMTCQRCNVCMSCGKPVHPGVSCSQMGSLQEKNVITNLNNPYLQQPPEGDQKIVKIYSILTEKITNSFNIPRRIAKVYEISNSAQEYWFSFTKPKKNIFSDLLDENEKNQAILNNTFNVEKNFYSFPEKINNKNEKKFILYLEVMYDELKTQDPDTIPESDKTSKVLLIQFSNKFLINSPRAVRIIYLIELQ